MPLAETGWFARRIMEPSSAYETGQAVGRSILIGLVAFALLGGGLVFVVTMIKATTSKTRGWIIGAMVSGVAIFIIETAGVLSDRLFFCGWEAPFPSCLACWR